MRRGCRRNDFEANRRCVHACSLPNSSPGAAQIGLTDAVGEIMKKDKLKEQIEEMTVDNEREELVTVDLLDVLLDPDNREPLTFLDENGKVLTFEQVAVIPHDDKDGERQLFTVLKPLDKIEGVADDEAIVFRVSVDDDGNTSIKPEEDDEIAIAVYDEYIKLLKANGVDC